MSLLDDNISETNKLTQTSSMEVTEKVETTETTTTTTTASTVTDSVVIDVNENSDSKKLEQKTSSTSVAVWFEEKKEEISFDPETTAVSLVVHSIEAFGNKQQNHRSYGFTVHNHLDQVINPTAKLSESLKDVSDLDLIYFKKGKTHSSMNIKLIISGWLERKAADKKKWDKYFFLIKKGSQMLEYYEQEPDHVDCSPYFSIPLNESKIEVISDGFNFTIETLPSESSKSLISTITRGLLTTPTDEPKFTVRVADKAEKDKWRRGIATAMFLDHTQKITKEENALKRNVMGGAPNV